jgi:hypothetical protein
MRFKGYNVRWASQVVQLTKHVIAEGSQLAFQQEQLNACLDPNGVEVKFGQVVSHNATLAGKLPKGAIETTRTWNDGNDTPVWVTFIPGIHSRTDMMYGPKGRLFVAKDGGVYTGRYGEEHPLLQQRLKRGFGGKLAS